MYFNHDGDIFINHVCEISSKSSIFKSRECKECHEIIEFSECRTHICDLVEELANKKVISPVPLKCHWCEKLFWRSLDNYGAHDCNVIKKIIKHKVFMKPALRCITCNGHGSYDALVNHKCIFRCTICSEYFESEKELETHHDSCFISEEEDSSEDWMQAYHRSHYISNKEDLDLSSESSSEIDHNSNSSGDTIKEWWKVVFDNLKELERHKKVCPVKSNESNILDEGEWKCPECEKYITIRTLKDRIEHGQICRDERKRLKKENENLHACFKEYLDGYATLVSCIKCNNFNILSDAGNFKLDNDWIGCTNCKIYLCDNCPAMDVYFEHTFFECLSCMPSVNLYSSDSDQESEEDNSAESIFDRIPKVPNLSKLMKTSYTTIVGPINNDFEFITGYKTSAESYITCTECNSQFPDMNIYETHTCKKSGIKP